TLLLGCTVQLVAPYNPDLQQKASAMQAEVAAWDLTMRGTAGTVGADPRNPDVVAILNKWRGESDAMLTLAISNDPNLGDCSDALKAVHGAIETAIPVTLRDVAQSSAPTAQGERARPSGCEAALVANIETGIDDIEKALKYCRAPWIPDTYFTPPSQTPVAA